MSTEQSLQDKIFNTIIYCVLAISVVSIIGNFIAKFPLAINYKWILLFFYGSGYIGLNRMGATKENHKFIFFIVIILGFMPFSWIDSGGSTNNTIAYVFLIMISIAVLFIGNRRLVLAATLIVVFISLYILEYKYPALIRTYSEASQFTDRLIQIPLTLTLTLLLVRKFSDAYNDEKLVIQEYVIKLKDANDKLAFLTHRDALTGIHNRRAFDEAVIACNEKGSNAYVVFFDLDRFKNINDIYGHKVGDQCICYIAERCVAYMPAETFISRWGGDEFALIYHGSYEDINNDLTRYMKNIVVECEGQKIEMHLSIGATLLEVQDDLDSVVRRVDRLLYDAKNSGRNNLKIG